MSSLSAMAPWRATAFSAVANSVHLVLGGTLVALDLSGVPLAGALAAVPLGLAFGRMYRAHDQALEVRDLVALRAKQRSERERQAALDQPVQASAVRDDVAAAAAIGGQQA